MRCSSWKSIVHPPIAAEHGPSQDQRCSERCQTRGRWQGQGGCLRPAGSRAWLGLVTPAVRGGAVLVGLRNGRLRAGRLRAGCRGCGGGDCWKWGVVRFSYTARPPPPVILPGAAFALLCLAGAFAPCFALRARAAACCLRGGVSGPSLYVFGYEWRGSEKGATWGGVDAASANPQDSNQHGLARATRLGLPGPGPQVHPTRSASRAVRCSPVSRLFPCPGMSRGDWAPNREHARREPFSGD